jgi:hypothetical protein
VCPAGIRYIRAAGKRQAFVFIPTTVGWIEPSKLSMCLHQASYFAPLRYGTKYRLANLPVYHSDDHEPRKKYKKNRSKAGNKDKKEKGL